MTGQSQLHDRITTFIQSPRSNWAAFLWGLAEATVFFLVPDILIGFVSLFNWRKGLLVTGLAVIGALAGGSLMFRSGASDPERINRVLTSIPLIDAELVDRVNTAVRTSGLPALVNGPFQGIPYKIYAAQAGQLGLPFGLFLLVSIPARLERFLPIMLVAAVAGRLMRKIIRRHTGLIVLGYLALWLGVYTLYFLKFY